MTSVEMDLRIRRIRMPIKGLASAADVHSDSIYRFVKGLHCLRRSTNRAIAAALVSEELALRDHLVSLHGPGKAAGI
ncbi:hypothetical protein [Chelatococcus asaccharovorans]|nr:hypothetical protein [Chelatococcus asaccharovorans]MBS7703191.1 hypothetical protein [Chelatococcus asaccharovorans]